MHDIFICCLLFSKFCPMEGADDEKRYHDKKLFSLTMKQRKFFVPLVLISAVVLLTGAACAKQEEEDTSETDDVTTVEGDQGGAQDNIPVVIPSQASITVSPQKIANNAIVIDEVAVTGQSWIVVHADNAGKPGDVIGYVAISAGTLKSVVVALDVARVTPILYAMVHTDAGEVGIFEAAGADVPVKNGDTIVMGMITVIPAEASPEVTEQTMTEVKEISMVARKWEFVPATITVKKGDSVRFRIKSEDVKHGFSLPDFNVKQELNPGETTVVEFVADKTGTFSFSCSVYCGDGHTGMTGTLIVEE